MSGRARTEIACCLSWFRNWNEEQRQEFANLLIKMHGSQNASSSQQEQSLDDLMNTMTQLSLNKAKEEGPR